MNLSNEFSILMTVYHKDSPEFFDKALISIIDQTLPPSEITLVADGPLTADLNQIIDRYIHHYPSLFNFIQLKENVGIGHAMNTGLKACKYEYVARMDADDIALPNRFEKQFTYLNEHPETDIIGAMIEEFHDTPGDMQRYRKVAVEHKDIIEYTKSRCPFNHMTVIYKRSKVLSAGCYWPRRTFEDYHLWYRMIRAGHQCHNLPEVLVYARIGNNMVGRRRGKAYLLLEREFFRLMRSDGFISFFEFYKSLIIRTIIRILPIKMTKLIYDKILR